MTTVTYTDYSITGLSPSFEMKHHYIIGYCQAYYEIARWSILKTNRSDTYNPTQQCLNDDFETEPTL